MATATPRKLKENQIIATQLVASGVNGREIAKTLSVSEETVSRWRQEPQFKKAVKRFQDATMEHVEESLKAMASVAVEVLGSILVDPKMDPKLRAQIAMKVIWGQAELGTSVDEPVELPLERLRKRSA